jgi:hypothetical protein
VSRIIMIVYVVVGVIVASAQGYLGNISGVDDALNLLLAVVLWPLLLIGVDFKIRIGDDNGGGGGRNNGVLPAAGPALVALRTIASSVRNRRTEKSGARRFDGAR